MKWKDNTLRKQQVVVKRKFLEKIFQALKEINKRTLGLELKNQARQFNY